MKTKSFQFESKAMTDNDQYYVQIIVYYCLDSNPPEIEGIYNEITCEELDFSKLPAVDQDYILDYLVAESELVIRPLESGRGAFLSDLA